MYSKKPRITEGGKKSREGKRQISSVFNPTYLSLTCKSSGFSTWFFFSFKRKKNGLIFDICYFLIKKKKNSLGKK